MILSIGTKVLRKKIHARNPTTPKREIFKKGLTLIELLLVVAIITVLAGLNFPAFRTTYNRLKLENCALNILALSRFAQQKAIVTSGIYRLNFDPVNKTYWLSQILEEPSQEPRLLTGRFGAKFQIPADIELALSGQEINFYPSGESDNATIALSNEQHARFEIFKSGAFGEFKVQEKKE